MVYCPPSPPEVKEAPSQDGASFACSEYTGGVGPVRVTSAEKKHPVDASCAREAAVSRRRTRSQAASQRRRCRSTPSQKGFAEVNKQSFATNLRQIRKEASDDKRLEKYSRRF